MITLLAGVVPMLLLLSLPVESGAGVIEVPSDEPTLLGALERSAPGDEIVLLDGEYALDSCLITHDVRIRSKAEDATRVTIHAAELAQWTVDSASLHLDFLTMHKASADPAPAMIVLRGETAELEAEGCTFLGNAVRSDSLPAGRVSLATCRFGRGAGPEYGVYESVRLSHPPIGGLAIEASLFEGRGLLPVHVGPSSGGSGSVRVADSRFVECGHFVRVEGLALAGAIMDASGSAEIDRCFFERTTGGVAFARGGQVSASTFEACVVQPAVNSWGGHLTLRDDTFLGNVVDPVSTFGWGTVSIRPGTGEGPASADISLCAFHGNTAVRGGGIWLGNSATDVAVRGCTFAANFAGDGGGIAFDGDGILELRLAVAGCTFDRNDAVVGAHLSQTTPGLDGGGSPANHHVHLERCQFTNAQAGRMPIWIPGLGAVEVSCTNIFGNVWADSRGTHHDWATLPDGEDIRGRNGNLSSDPLYCNVSPLDGQDWSLSADSESAAACAGQVVGAWPVGCSGVPGPSSLQESSWGKLKTAYR